MSHEPQDNCIEKVITVDASDLRCPHSVLRQVSKPVRGSNVDPEPIVSCMLRILYEVEHSRGLSAIQLGIPVRIFVVNINRTPGKEIIVIDPVVVSISGRLVTRREGCMSLPNFKGPLARRNKVTIRGYDLNDDLIEISSHGYEANVIQHEIDHLDGILYWDRMNDNFKPEPIQGDPNVDCFQGS